MTLFKACTSRRFLDEEAKTQHVLMNRALTGRGVGTQRVPECSATFLMPSRLLLFEKKGLFPFNVIY